MCENAHYAITQQNIIYYVYINIALSVQILGELDIEKNSQIIISCSRYDFQSIFIESISTKISYNYKPILYSCIIIALFSLCLLISSMVIQVCAQCFSKGV